MSGLDTRRRRAYRLDCVAGGCCILAGWALADADPGEAPTPSSAWVRELPPSKLQLAASLKRANGDGPLLAFSALVDRNWDVFTWDFEPTHAPVRVTRQPYDESAPSLSDDHSYCVYETVDGRLWRAALGKDAPPTPLPFASDQRFDMHPAVSPDGNSVVLATSLDRASDDTDLIVYNLLTKSFGRRLALMSYQHYPAWAPDGRHVVFSHLQGRLQTGEPISEIWVMRTDAPWARQITLLDARSLSPAWSPDGRFVAFTCDRQGSFDLWQVEPATRAYRRLTQGPAADSDPVFSPDGRSLIFVSTRGRALGLWRLELETGKITPVQPFGPDRAVPCKDPDWK